MEAPPAIFRLPAEIVDVIFDILRPPFLEAGGKTALIACGSVCRYWRCVALPHIFNDLAFSYRSTPVAPDPVCSIYDKIDNCSRTEQWEYWTQLRPDWSIYHRQSLSPFLEFLKNTPSIAALVKRLALKGHLGHRHLTPATPPSLSGALLQPVGTHSVSRTLKTDPVVFRGVIEMLPNIQEVVLSQVVLGAISWSHTPLRPLKRLTLTVEDYQDAHICQQLAFFGEVERLLVKGFRQPHQGCDSHPVYTGLRVKSIFVANDPWTTLPSGFIRMLATPDTASVLRVLDIGRLSYRRQPQMIEHLQKLIDIAGPKLEQIKLTTPYNLDGTILSMLHGRNILPDLTPCVSLRALTIRSRISPGQADDQSNYAWVWIPDIFRISRTCPQLQSFTLGLLFEHTSSPKFEATWFSNFQSQLLRLEDALLAIIKDTKVGHIAFGSKEIPLEESEAGIIKQMFPRLCERHLIQIYSEDEPE